MNIQTGGIIFMTRFTRRNQLNVQKNVKTRITKNGRENGMSIGANLVLKLKNRESYISTFQPSNSHVKPVVQVLEPEPIINKTTKN